MKTSFAPALATTLKWEGGLVDDPRDPGGITNFGITLPALEKHRGVPCTRQDIINLKLSEASDIYAAEYWAPCRCDDMPIGVDLILFDSAVNSGVVGSIKMLQESVGLLPDGLLGPFTLAHVQRKDVIEVLTDFMAKRALHDAKLHTVGVFGYGWFRRMFDVHKHALDLILPK